MALSGSFDFNLSRDEIINAAYRVVGIASPTATQITNAAQALNLIVKNWQGDDIFLWSQEWIQQTLIASSKILGTDGLDYECIKKHTSGSSTKPITGANYSSYWKQLTTATADAWVTATGYISVCNYTLDQKIVSIEKAFLRRDEVDYSLNLYSQEGYLGISDKYVSGQPSGIWFNRLLTPEIFIYPLPENTTDVIHMLAVNKLNDFDATGDNADLNAGWLRALKWALIVEIAPEFGIDKDDVIVYAGFAEKYKNSARGINRESTSLWVQPNLNK